MWFDAIAALATVGGGRKPATHPPATISVHVADVAEVAANPCENQKSELPASYQTTVKTSLHSAPDRENPFVHGQSPGGRPTTWTGKVVSLADWRQLSEWEKHGPNARN